jgi:tetratricopeptide (TPR) repeat protein
MASSEKLSPPAPPSCRQLLLICLVLLAAVLAVYGQTFGRHFEFVNVDDDDYVTANPRVQDGITLPSLKWALTSFYSFNWHPLTWMSLQLDCQLYGLSSAGFHFTNVVLHAANTLLLFWLLQRLTGAVWCSAAVAAFFGIHPAHVESVAWVTERKDVLSTLFWLLTLAAYAWYAERPGWGRYLPVALALLLGLMAKPMVVTLPAVLLLLDVWPLRRWPPDQAEPSRYAPASARRLLLEKLPLFLIVAATLPLTLQAQQGAIRTLDQLPISLRISNALVSYVKYIGLMLWPSGLAIYYPHPFKQYPLWEPALAALLLAGLTVAVCWSWRSRPYLAVGWFWYLGTMVPVIGLIQVGTHELADRYTYVPSIGLSIVLVWGMAELAARQRMPQQAMTGLAAAALLACLILARRQVGFWKNSEVLWSRDLAVTRETSMARDKLGVALMYQKGRLREARELFRRALQLGSQTPWTHGNLAAVEEQLGNLDEAAKHYRLAIETEFEDEKLPETQEKSLFGLGRVRERQGRYREAQEHYEEVLAIKPSHIGALIGLAGALEEQGFYAESQRHYEEALLREPNSPVIYNHLGRVLQRQHQPEKSLEYFDRALQLQPDSADSWNNKGVALEQLNELEKARQCYQRAVDLNPEQLLFHCNLAYALAESGHADEASAEYAAAFRLYPDWPKAALREAWNLATRPDARQRNGRQALRIAQQACQATHYAEPLGLDRLAAAYAELGQFDEAIKWQRQAVKLFSDDVPAEIRKGVQERLHLYESHKPYRQPPVLTGPSLSREKNVQTLP